MLANSPRSRVVVVPKMGHMPMGMAAPECLDALLEFSARPDADAVDTACIDGMKPMLFVLPPVP